MTDDLTFVAVCAGILALVLALAGLILPESTPITSFPYGNLTGVPQSFPYGNLTGVPNVQLEHGLVLWLPLNDGIGNASDFSGCLNHGLISGALWVDGKYGKALSFNGSTDYVSVLHSASFDVSNITISLWMKFDTVPAEYTRIVSKSGYIFELLLQSDQKIWGRIIVDDLWRSSPTSSVLVVGIWYHVVLIYDGSYVRLYVNSVEVTPATAYSGAVGSDASSVLIGCKDGVIKWFDGVIDDVRVYNRVLSQDEITALYNLPV